MLSNQDLVFLYTDIQRVGEGGWLISGFESLHKRYHQGPVVKQVGKWSKIGAFGDMLTNELRAILGLGCYGKSGAHLFPEKRQHFWERKAKNGRRAAGANCLSRHHLVELRVHVYDLNCCGCSSFLCLVSSFFPHKTSVSASSSSLRLVKE